MTYLNLINSVLRLLREDEVTSPTQSAYAKLIGQFVNETKREVEDSTNWVQLRNTIQVTTEADTFRYGLTGAGNRYRVLQVVNDTQDQELQVAPYAWMNRQFTMISSGVAKGAPTKYDINGSTTDGDPYVDLWPVPDDVYVINFNIVLPQDDLSDAGDTLTVPSWPVILGAYSKALSERGEDGGQSYGEALGRYAQALGDAIAIDMGKVPHELIWEVE